MWIAFRLLLAVIGYLIRQLGRGSLGRPVGFYEGIEYSEHVGKQKGKVLGFRLGMPRRSPTWVRMHPESAVDRFFKRIGVANEIQTGDEAFDDTVYVMCDHPYVAAILQETPALRRAIRDLFDAGYRRVQFNGSMVIIQHAGSDLPMPRDLQLLKALHTASAKLEDEMPSRFADPFLWKALLVEGMIWGILGYAIGAVVEMAWHREDFHLDHGAVVKLGLMVAAATFVVLVALIIATMRGSSRGHRVIVESALVLLLGLPAAGIQITGDTNRALDDAPALPILRTASECEVRVQRGRRNRQSYSYHLWLAQEGEVPDVPLPQEIEVTKRLCDVTTPGDVVQISVGRGRWGIPWYRKITVGGTSWTAPL
ncbi:MAG: hypothetical protein JWP01_64 [Myxococcales bacterium]|nr:hypothetical protein [Myxococcales bacterium]